MKVTLSDKLEKCYWRLAFHIEKVIYGEIRLDSPTIPDTKILTSTDEFYKSMASNLDKIAYDTVAHEKKCIEDLERDIDVLVSWGADKTRKSGVVKEFFEDNLERCVQERASTSYCPSCSNMYYPKGNLRSKCKALPGKEFTVYSCEEFDDQGTVNWDVYHSQIDEEMKIIKSVLNELGEDHNLGKPDLRIQRAVGKYISRLK
jgi:hypothetical protein